MKKSILSGTTTLLLVLALFAFVSSLKAPAQSMTYVPVITPLAGGSTTACSTATDTVGDGCPATQAILKNPWGSLADRQGNLYIADYGNNLVRRIDAQTGIITLIAGIPSGSTATVCSAATDTVGDGCPATQAKLDQPLGLAFDPFGNLVIADYTDHRVRVINSQTGIITTILGTGSTSAAVPSNTAPAVAASTPIGEPEHLVFDHAGNLYVTSAASYSVYLVVANNGVIVPGTSLAYNFAGTGKNAHGADGSSGPATTFNLPRGLGMDPEGNILVTEYSACVVRKITSPFQSGILNISGTVVNTVAGKSCSSTITDGGQATSTSFDFLQDMALDNSGILYLAQYNSPGDAIRTVNLSTEIVNTVAGNATRGDTGDNGPAMSAEIDGPTGLSLDVLGDVFSNGYSNSIYRRISLNNRFQSQAVGGTSGASNLIAQANQNVTLQSAVIAPTLASTTEFAAGTPSGCSSGGALAEGAYCTVPVTFTPALPGLRSAPLVLTDSNSVTSTIGLTGVGIAPAVAFTGGAIRTMAGTGTAGFGNPAGLAVAAQVNAPRGGVVDSAGNIYFADSGNNIIRKISAAGVISTVAGNGMSGYSGDGSTATGAKLNAPSKVVVDAAGNLFIADTGNNVIRYISVDTGNISTIAGTANPGYTGDGGLATAANLNQPEGIAVDRGGNVYVADTKNNAIRYFTIGGYISTFAGTGQAGYSGDNGPSASAELSAPAAVTLDASGNLYIADTGNTVIRMVSIANQITTFAGKAGGTANSGDGSSATGAQLIAPSDVVVDAAGEMYIASGEAVRMVDTSGIISTIVGSGTGTSYSGDGGIASSAALGSSQLSLMLDGEFNLYISDTAANRLLLATQAAPSVGFSAQNPGTTGPIQSVSIRNTGNSALSISNLTLSADFILNSGGSGSCITSTVLAAGQSCLLEIAFSPAAATNGVLNGTLVITDNALNNTASTQTIALSGNAEILQSTTTAVTVIPSTLVYGGSSVTATAVVSGGSSPTGSVMLTLNGVSIGTVALSSGQASIALPNLSARTSTVEATYRGDNVNESSSGSASATVQPAVLTVTATSITAVYGSSFPALTYTLTGFVNGDTIGVVSGVPAETTTATGASIPGTYPIMISAGTLSAANYIFKFVNGAVTVQTTGSGSFTLSASPSLAVVNQGQSVQYTITLNPVNFYKGTVAISCGGLPANASCSPAGNLTADGTGTPVSTQLTVLTSKNPGSTNAAMLSHRGTSHMWMAIGFPFSFVGVLVCGRKRRLIGKMLAIVLLASTALGVTSCATSSTEAFKGTFWVTVTGADSSANLSSNVVIYVSIQ